MLILLGCDKALNAAVLMEIITGWGGKKSAVGHNRKACGTHGRFYRGRERERGRLVDTSQPERDRRF